MGGWGLESPKCKGEDTEEGPDSERKKAQCFRKESRIPRLLPNGNGEGGGEI